MSKKEIGKIKIGNKEIPLRLSVSAIKNIEELIGGDISKIGDYIRDCGTGEQLCRLVYILHHLANGYVAKHNAEIDLGLIGGEKLEFYDAETFLNVFDISDIDQLSGAIFNVVNKDTEFDMPDEVEIKEEPVDVVLEEIKEKND